MVRGRGEDEGRGLFSLRERGKRLERLALDMWRIHV